MKTLASKQSTIDKLRISRRITIVPGAMLYVDRETVTVADGEPIESSRGERREFVLDLKGSDSQEVVVNGNKLTVPEILAFLEQLADDVEDAENLKAEKAAQEAAALADAKQAEAAAVAEPAQ